MAEALTGDRRHFWLKPSSTPGSKQPTGPKPDTYDWTWEQTKAERERERSKLGRPRGLGQPLTLAKDTSEQELRLFESRHELQSDGERRDNPARPRRAVVRRSLDR